MPFQKFPFSINIVQPKIDELYNTIYADVGGDFFEVGPKKYIKRHNYVAAAETIYNFEVRLDDVWIVTYPRSGTTMTQEIIWLILNDDYEKAANVALHERFPFLESSTSVSDKLKAKFRSEVGDDEETQRNIDNLVDPQWEVLKSMSGRRFIKTHLPFSLLPPTLLTSGAKVVYVARNPKDVAVSRYHHNNSLRIFNPVDDFKVCWDWFETTSYWEHLEEGWKHRNEKNVLFLFYEDIVKDYKTAIDTIANFLEKIMTEEQISKLVDHIQIDNFRKVQLRSSDHIKFFFTEGRSQQVRVGKTGNWSDLFTNELDVRANKWIEDHYKNTSLRFPIDILT